MLKAFVWIIAAMAAIVTVSLHYEIMNAISDRVIPWAQRRMPGRRAISIVMFCLLFGHVVEILMFALVMFGLIHFPAVGAMEGLAHGQWSDCLYLSAVDYTSLGADGIHLTGDVRALTAVETLVGMMMIAWSRLLHLREDGTYVERTAA
ncbi:MAG: hypothetical protein KGI97_05915 [Alphaproteobacteria bacterium]|nr:hypothetical protein [Alphaproteobacteria bacterium]